MDMTKFFVILSMALMAVVTLAAALLAYRHKTARDEGITLLAEAHAQLEKAGTEWAYWESRAAEYKRAYDAQIAEQAKIARRLKIAEEQRDAAYKELAALKAGIHVADDPHKTAELPETAPTPVASAATANGKRPRGSRKRAAE